MKKKEDKKRFNSIRQRVILFSVILYSLIVITGSVVFLISIRQSTRNSVGQELVKAVEIEDIKLNASVNGEIALAMKMATSPLIMRHFLDPYEPNLKRMAFDEIEGYRKAFASEMAFWASDVDKEFYFSEDNHYTVDDNNPDNYWYKMTLHETEKYNFNINYNPEIQRIMLWINAPVFDSRRNPIGLVGTGIDLTEFVNSIFKGYKNSGELYLFNAAGEITGAKDTSLFTNKVDIKKHLGSLGEDVFSRATKLSGGQFEFFQISSGVVALGTVPALGWFITAIEPVGITNILANSMTAVFLAMLAVTAGIFITFYIYITQMLKPMKYMVQTLDHIAVDWDLTKKLELNRHDEIGTVGDFFNLTFGKMRDLLLNIKGKTVSLADTGDELGSYMIKTRQDIDDINASIQKMRTHILSQSDSVSSASGTMELIIKGIGKLDEHIIVQAENVAHSSSAIEEMLANIQSVTQTLVKNTANIDSLAKSSAAGRADLQNVSTDIEEIAKESEGLLQINSVMQTIASQTNLLAMNAAIEAAHAGESGSGFAVVADEIRKLAENSSKQSKTISAVLKKIKTMIDDITKSTSVVIERFDAIENEVKTVSEQEAQIRNAMEEQGVGSRQILEAVTQLNSVTGLVRKESSGMINDSKEVLNQNVALKNITGEIAGDMDDMTSNADDITAAFTRVAEITQENKENIVALSKDISLFKVE